MHLNHPKCPCHALDSPHHTHRHLRHSTMQETSSTHSKCPSGMAEKPMFVSPNHTFCPFHEGHTSLLSTCSSDSVMLTNQVRACYKKKNSTALPISDNRQSIDWTPCSLLRSMMNMCLQNLFAFARCGLQARGAKARHDHHRQALASHCESRV